MNNPPGVSIGQAAALFGLAPSTLRWWEAQGVLPEPPRINGRRVYTETELRRIGLAHLCCITGAMPLEQAAAVTTGTGQRNWQQMVLLHIDVLQDRISQLQAARAYLQHLVQCPDDDMVNNCPYLDAELVKHTPRRQASAPGLVAAALAGPGPAPGDEMSRTRDEIRRCASCGRPLAGSGRGRPRKYCSQACRQRHYRRAATSNAAVSA